MGDDMAQFMKTLIAATSVLALASCGGADGSSDNAPPKADITLPDDVIVVTFAPNQNEDAVEGTCNPYVTYQMKTERESLRLNVNYVLDGKKMMGSGFSMIERGLPGTIDDAMPMTNFKPYEVACGEVDLSINEFTCRNSLEDDENSPCPDVQFKGTDMFKSFKGIPE